jgi:hypothetical protein
MGNNEDFMFKAVVDWIEVEIETALSTHYDAIRRHGRLSYVAPINPGSEGKSATIFRLRIHDPETWSSVATAIGDIANKFDLAKPFKVVGIEVALDAYGQDVTTAHEFAALAATFAKFTTLTNANRRMYRELPDGVFSVPLKMSSVVRLLSEGWQIGVGDKASDCYQHIYFKTTDHNKDPLKVDLHRARIEISLRGNMLPCSTLKEWSCCNFANLAKPYFSFRQLRSGLSPIEQVCADYRMNIGKRAKLNRKEDSALNAIARYKLRDLSDRWKIGNLASWENTAEPMACGNSGEANQSMSNKHGNSDQNSNNYISSDLIDKDKLLPSSKSISSEAWLESILVQSQETHEAMKRIDGFIEEVS